MYKTALFGVKREYELIYPDKTTPLAGVRQDVCGKRTNIQMAQSDP
jgi:hypothetical protein